METFTKGRFTPALIIISLITMCLLESCKSEKKNPSHETSTEPEKEVAEVQDDAVEIITKNMDFLMSDTIPSGWNTLRYKNQSNQTHFVLIDKYPEGKSSKDAEELVAVGDVLYHQPERRPFRVSSIDRDEQRAYEMHDRFLDNLIMAVSPSARQRLSGLGE